MEKPPPLPPEKTIRQWSMGELQALRAAWRFLIGLGQLAEISIPGLAWSFGRWLRCSLVTDPCGYAPRSSQNRARAARVRGLPRQRPKSRRHPRYIYFCQMPWCGCDPCHHWSFDSLPEFIARPEEQRGSPARRADRDCHFDSRGSFCGSWMEVARVSEEV